MENKRNFQRELDKIIDYHVKNNEKPEVLLHSCCGPCSSYVLEYLTKYFKIKLLYFDPNIYPEEEYYRRLSTQREVIEKIAPETELIEGEYDPNVFLDAVKGLEGEPEGGRRCEVCIRLRMEEAARYAKRHGTDYFTTTLSVSPHKNAPYINKAGEELESEYGVRYLVADFKKREGYKRSTELCRLYGFYRQDYCGCKFALR